MAYPTPKHHQIREGAFGSVISHVRVHSAASSPHTEATGSIRLLVPFLDYLPVATASTRRRSGHRCLPLWMGPARHLPERGGFYVKYMALLCFA
jgi:hypothetical protein